jgi:hypothetical protein
LLGRLAGALNYISPWKARTGNQQDDDYVPVDDEDASDGHVGPEEQLMDHLVGADEQQGYGDHQEGGWGAHEPLHEFARRLPNSVDRPQNSHEQLDESTEISAADTSHERQQVQAAGVFSRDGGGLSMTDLGGCTGAGRDHVRSFGGAFAGSGFGAGGAGGSGFGGGASWSGLEEREGAAERSLMLRPRGVRKEFMMPLRVAQTVSRMGKENIQHKRALKLKFDAQDLKAYMVSAARCECNLRDASAIYAQPHMLSLKCGTLNVWLDDAVSAVED